jgi:hypothetical protein
VSIRHRDLRFRRRDTAALAFELGYQPGSPDARTRRNWVRNRYHKPSDDLAQPVDTAAAAKSTASFASDGGGRERCGAPRVAPG